MNNSTRSSHYEFSIYFEPIRVEANDRIEKKLFARKMIYLENCDELNGTLKFETSHKAIIKQFKANLKK